MLRCRLSCHDKESPEYIKLEINGFPADRGSWTGPLLRDFLQTQVPCFGYAISQDVILICMTEAGSWVHLCLADRKGEGERSRVSNAKVEVT